MKARRFTGTIIGTIAVIGGLGQVYGSSESPSGYMISGPTVQSSIEFVLSSERLVLSAYWQGRCVGWLFGADLAAIPAFGQLPWNELTEQDYESRLEMIFDGLVVERLGSYLGGENISGLTQLTGSRCNKHGVPIAPDIFIKNTSNYSWEDDAAGGVTITFDGQVMFATPTSP